MKISVTILSIFGILAISVSGAAFPGSAENDSVFTGYGYGRVRAVALTRPSSEEVNWDCVDRIRKNKFGRSSEELRYFYDSRNVSAERRLQVTAITFWLCKLRRMAEFSEGGTNEIQATTNLGTLLLNEEQVYEALVSNQIKNYLKPMGRPIEKVNQNIKSKLYGHEGLIEVSMSLMALAEDKEFQVKVYDAYPFLLVGSQENWEAWIRRKPVEVFRQIADVYPAPIPFTPEDAKRYGVKIPDRKKELALFAKIRTAARFVITTQMIPEIQREATLTEQEISDLGSDSILQNLLTLQKQRGLWPSNTSRD